MGFGWRRRRRKRKCAVVAVVRGSRLIVVSSPTGAAKLRVHTRFHLIGSERGGVRYCKSCIFGGQWEKLLHRYDIDVIWQARRAERSAVSFQRESATP